MGLLFGKREPMEHYYLGTFPPLDRMSDNYENNAPLMIFQTLTDVNTYPFWDLKLNHVSKRGSEIQPWALKLGRRCIDIMTWPIRKAKLFSYSHSRYLKKNFNKKLHRDYILSF